MFSFFTSFGASTVFQKCRLEITAKTFDGPNEQSLRNIINTFCGNDPQTKSQIAFATIIKKLLTSDSRNNWIYLLKNLIIIDRIVEEKIFNQEIAALSIPTIQIFKENDPKYLMVDTQRILKLFFKIIKEKSSILIGDKHIFCFKRSQRMEYLSKLTIPETLKEIQSIQQFFQLTFEFVSILSGKRLLQEFCNQKQKILSSRQQFENSKLLQYLYLQILHKLMLYYSCQLLCNNYFLQTLIKKSKNIKEQDIKRYKKHILKFKQNSNDYIRFVQERKHIKGFEELNYKQLNPFQNQDVIKMIDELISQQHVEQETHKVLQYTSGDDLMKVQKKPLSDLNLDILIPRIHPRIHKRSSKQDKQLGSENDKQVTSFSNYVSSFSGQFPQKEVMTIDLIMVLKDQITSQDQLVQDSIRDSCNFSHRDTNISSNYDLSYKQYLNNSKILLFFSVFSALPSHWNQ